jgi:2-oxoglutarate dehydrogenase E2 component (dihydrolipoamide succinyltransferase)
VGEYVQADEIVAVVETDKINVDIRSTHAGVITKYFANEGETVAVDSQFFEIDTEAKGSAAPAQAPAKQEAKSAETPKKVLICFN